jgi:predicted nucleic acid-binding protein
VSYLIDTNVIPELTRPKPTRSVETWFEEVADEALHISMPTLGEPGSGAEKLPASKRRETLRHWVDQQVPGWFGERRAPVDTAVTDT